MMKKKIAHIFVFFVMVYASFATGVSLSAALAAVEMKTADSQSWEKWEESVRGYLNTMQALQEKADELIQNADEQIGKAFQENSTDDVQKLCAEVMQKIDSIVQEMNAMHTPRVLQGFHRKQVEVLQYQYTVYKAVMQNDEAVGRRADRMALVSEKESLEELSRICKKQGAPRNVIDAFKESIQHYKQFISKIQ